MILGHFRFIFPILGAKKIFCHAQLHGILAPCQISEKTNHIVPRKHLDRRMDGRTGRQTDPIL